MFNFFIAPPDGGDYILAVTFTFIWTNNGLPADMDKNGRSDVAFRGNYYSDSYEWRMDDHYDVETIALHETGHGMSLAHFGTAFRTTANGKLHFSPLSVMNAAYTGIHHDLLPTDLAGFCSVWSS